MELLNGRPEDISGRLNREIRTYDLLDSFTINGSNCLDIRNLKLTKKHPSPDMVKIRFAKGVKVNMKLLKAKATSGKIKIIKGTDSVDISIW